MESDYSERLVKPPGMEMVSSGRRFRPSSAYKRKYVFIALLTTVIIYAIAVLTIVLSAVIVNAIRPSDIWAFISPVMEFVNFWYWVLSIIVLIPGLLIANLYINSIEYSVVGESGEAMPEVYSKKGILDVTERHIPLNAITNVSSRAGPFDRIFGIGSVFIETAGSGGGVQLGGVLSVDMKIEGVPFYRELRDHIIREMRQTKGVYRLTTESSFDEDSTIAQGVSGNELALVLREILRVLRKLDEKLDRLG
ncbi:MAG: PH domain-containing protein [Candidatus Thorarchaeota archaeon]